MSTDIHETPPETNPLVPEPVGPATARRSFGTRLTPRLRRAVWNIAGVSLFAVIAVLVGRGLLVDPGAGAATTPSVPAVSVEVAPVVREEVYTQVGITAEFRPYVQVDLHAKVSGYVQEINVDFGDRVKAGQLLARLEVPEAKSELDRALAAQKRAKADYRDAHLVYTRLSDVMKEHPNLVAQQELDAAEAKDGTTEAAIAAAKAEVEKYQTLIDYERIVAPFDGVVTKRFADPGTLIQAGTASDTQSLPLVRVSDNYRLRLDFPVSVPHVRFIRLGDSVDVQVESLGGKTFKGKIARFTNKVDDDTRTMITEVEVPNPDLQLIPGMYATVLLKLERRPNALAIPTQAVSPEKGKDATVYLVTANHEIEERTVTLGLETPFKHEVLSGLKEGDLVMLGSRSQVKPGQKVEAKLATSPAQ